ncbi:PTS sugar transporter subunit IIA, partial [Pediococcus pentosaceus]
AMLVLKLKQPIEWKTFDNQPVDTVISFLIPERDQGNHLRYLSSVSKLLMHESFVQELKNAKSVEEIAALFKK